MNIVTYKIPIKITRDAKGYVDHQLDESKKEQTHVERLSTEDMNNIANIAQSIGAENERAKALAKKTLLSSENEANTFVLIKILS